MGHTSGALRPRYSASLPRSLRPDGKAPRDGEARKNKFGLCVDGWRLVFTHRAKHASYLSACKGGEGGGGWKVGKVRRREEDPSTRL